MASLNYPKDHADPLQAPDTPKTHMARPGPGGSWIGHRLGIIKKSYVLVDLLEVMLGAAAQNLAVCNEVRMT